MRLHLMVCGACTRFNGQMSLLRRAVRSMPPPDYDAPPDAEAIDPPRP